MSSLFNGDHFYYQRALASFALVERNFNYPSVQWRKLHLKWHGFVEQV